MATIQPGLIQHSLTSSRLFVPIPKASRCVILGMWRDREPDSEQISNNQANDPKRVRIKVETMNCEWDLANLREIRPTSSILPNSHEP
jgi:hypothetical protein